MHFLRHFGVDSISGLERLGVPKIPARGIIPVQDDVLHPDLGRPGLQVLEGLAVWSCGLSRTVEVYGSSSTTG